MLVCQLIGWPHLSTIKLKKFQQQLDWIARNFVHTFIVPRGGILMTDDPLIFILVPPWGWHLGFSVKNLNDSNVTKLRWSAW